MVKCCGSFNLSACECQQSAEWMQCNAWLCECVCVCVCVCACTSCMRTVCVVCQWSTEWVMLDSLCRIFYKKISSVASSIHFLALFLSRTMVHPRLFISFLSFVCLRRTNPPRMSRMLGIPSRAASIYLMWSGVMCTFIEIQKLHTFPLNEVEEWKARRRPV